MREALFNLLGPVEGLEVLDLFAGSGALGIEALSRGAASATFIDSDATSVRTVRDNLTRLREQRFELVRSDALAFLRFAARRERGWDLAFCDPPYRLAHRLAPELGRLLRPVLRPHARVVCESSSRQPLVVDLPPITERRYGDTLVAVYARGDEQES